MYEIWGRHNERVLSSVEKPLNPLHAAIDCVWNFEHICFGSEVQNIFVRRGWKLKRKRKQSQFHYTQTHTQCAAVNVRTFFSIFCWKPEARCRHLIPVSSLFDVLFTCRTCASYKSFYNKFHRNLYRRVGIHLTNCSKRVEKWKTDEMSRLDMSMTDMLLTLHNINARQMKYELNARLLFWLAWHSNCFFDKLAEWHSWNPHKNKQLYLKRGSLFCSFSQTSYRQFDTT